MNTRKQKCIGTCGLLNNSSFNVVEFDHFRMQAGLLTMGQRAVDQLLPLNSPRLNGALHES